MSKNDIEEMLNSVLKTKQVNGMNLVDLTDAISPADFFGEDLKSLEKSDLLLLLGKALWSIWVYNEKFAEVNEIDKDLNLLAQADEILNEEIKNYLKPLSEHGKKFKPKRRKGSITARTKYIRKLVKNNPNQRAKKLYAIAEKSSKGIGNMKLKTFANQVSLAKKTKIHD